MASFDGRTDDLEIGERQTITVHFVDGGWDDRLDAGGRYWITVDSTPPGAPAEGQHGTTVRFEPFRCE